MQTIAELVAFTEVARAGGFTAAAAKLDVAVPVLSKRVARLERALGARLLLRTTRHVALTEAGYAYLEHALRVVDELERAAAAVGELRTYPSGTLRITAPSEFSVYRLAPLLPEFLARYPDISIELTATDRVVDLAGERFDLGVRILRVPPHDLATRALCRVRPWVCASPAYLRRHGVPKKPADLERHNCLRIPESVTQGAWHFHRDGVDFQARVRGSFSSINSDVLAALAVAGCGIAFVPDYVAAGEVAAGRLRRVLADYESERSLVVYAVYPPRSFMPRPLRLFIDHLADGLREGPIAAD